MILDSIATQIILRSHQIMLHGMVGVAYRVSVFSLNVSKSSNFAFSTVRTIKSQFASKLAVGFQNILRKNPLPVVSLVSPRETCLDIEGGTKPACNQWRLLVSNPWGVYYLWLQEGGL